MDLSATIWEVLYGVWNQRGNEGSYILTCIGHELYTLIKDIVIPVEVKNLNFGSLYHKSKCDSWKV